MKKGLCLVLVLAMIFVVSIPVNHASAATLNKTWSQALSWLRSNEGVKLDYDKVYGAQCVDLIFYYYNWLGVGVVWGNGCDFATNTVPSGMTRIKGATPQPGDVLVYAGGTGAGHVAIYESNSYIWQQGGDRMPLTRSQSNYKYVTGSDGATYWGVVRPNFSTGTTQPVEADFFPYIGVSEISNTTALLTAHITNDINNVFKSVKNEGFYYGTSGDSLVKVTEGVAASKVSYLTYQLGTLDLTYDTGRGKWTHALKPGTRYYYKIWYQTDAGVFESNLRNFVTTGSSLAMTKQPVSQTIAAGANATFDVSADGCEITYQWQSKTPSSEWSNSKANGSTSPKLTFPATYDLNNNQYRCIIKDVSGKSITSNAVVLTVLPDLKITQQPVNKTGINGNIVKFTVSASGDELTYQWQYKNSEGTWANSPANGNKTACLSVPATADRNGFQYRCIVTDKYGNILISNAATLMVPYIKINSQPSSQTGSNGNIVKFTVSASGEGLAYQWQYKYPGGDWTNSPATGNKSANLSIPATADRNGYQYRCIVSDNYGNTLTSNSATLTVLTFKITTQPSNQTGSNGNTVKFTVAASGTGLAYQWQYKYPGGDWANSPATGNKTASLSVPATTDRNGYQYHCVITDNSGNKLTSNAATLTVSSLKITTQPSNQTGSNGNTVKFTVAASGTGLAYQWQYKYPGGDWANSPAAGNNTASLSVPATTDRNGYQYRCIVSDNSGNKLTSNAATLTVGASSSLKITTQPSSQTGSNGNTVKFTVAASGTGLTYQWQYKTPSGSWANSPATGNNTASLSVPATTDRNGYQYRCIVSDSSGNKLASNAATLTVSSLKITTQPSNQTGLNGNTVKFTVAASGDGIAYQWQYKTPTGSWANSPATGNNTASLSVPATTDRNGYQYRCIVSDKSGNKLTSNAATLTVVNLSITAQPKNQTEANGNKAKFTISANGEGLTYQWQYKVGSGSWNDSPAEGNKTATLIVPATPDRNGFQYRCIVKDKYGNKVTSNAATLTVQ